MKAHVVDANVMNAFQKERLLASEGPACAAINAMTNGHFIVLDEGGLCQQEWVDCAGGTFPLALNDWIADMLIVQKIRLGLLCEDSMHKELSVLGVPKKDHKWVRLAKGTQSDIIVTDDIDLFDPTKKSSSSKIIAAIKSNSSGPVAKHLRKRHGITVLTPPLVPSLVESYT